MSSSNSTPIIDSSTEAHSFVYGGAVIVLTIFYAVVMIALHVNRAISPFTSSFFALWNSLGVIDLVTITSRFIAWFVYDANWVPDEWRDTTYGYGWFKHYMAIPVMVWAGQAQFVGVVLLCANRYTSVCMPMRHRYMWSSRWFTAIPWIVSVDVPFVVLYYRVFVDNAPAFSQELDMAHVTLAIVVVVYLQAATVYRLFKSRGNKIGIDSTVSLKTIQTVSGGVKTITRGPSLNARPKPSKVEARLMVNASMLVLCMIGRGLGYALNLASQYKWITFTWFDPVKLMTVAYDVFSLCNPILLMITSKHCRQVVYQAVVKRQLYSSM